MIRFVALLDIVCLLVAFGARTVIQRRRTGDSGWRLGRPHSVAEGAARALLVLGAVGLAVALLRMDTTPPAALVVVAVIAAVAAVVLIAVAQLQMGESWRIGLDPDEETALVTSGIYASIRNPIYTGMVLFAVAHAVLTPSPWAVAAVVLILVGVQLQVRAVEEPYLERLHRDDYRSWTRISGRFVPQLG